VSEKTFTLGWKHTGSPRKLPRGLFGGVAGWQASTILGVPYHVRVSTRSNPSSDAVRLDLDRFELEDRFLQPYREGRPIVIGGKAIDLSDLERIRINETTETADQLLPLVQRERHQSDVWAVTIPDEWYIADYGPDVTDEFITGPPGSALPTTAVTTANDQAPAAGPDPRSVFVVHGRNIRARNAMFSFLRALGLVPIEWNEAVLATGRTNPYVGEVLNAAFSRAQTVVVLMTPDDEARLRDEFHEEGDPPHETVITPQARPNLLFEAGMAMGRNEDRTVLVELGICRPFSDIGGRHVVRMSDSTERRQELAQRLQAAGAAVRMTGTDWHTAGDFSVTV
jgi:predicted nucleotide-binding protein